VPQPQQKATVTFGKITEKKGHRVCLYGTGGIGKTTLACLMTGRTAVLDADESLSVLRSQLEAQDIPLPATVEAATWQDVIDALNSAGWDDIDNIVLDTVTKLEELCMAQVLKTIKNEKGHTVYKLEDYGYGKGYQHIFETFLQLLSVLDRHARAGRNVILIAHECTATVPNPKGEDFLRYEPRLQNPGSGKASIRYRVKEWADHVLFLGYDVEVDKAGVAQGSGTRTLHASELPHCMAKSRTCSGTIDIVQGQSPWEEIIK
jgi:phage nucleotide-binding protein